MLKQEEVKQLVRKDFTEANDEQIERLLGELSRDIEIAIHAKI